MIDPIAFRLGPFMIHWYGIILTSAMLLGVFLAGRQAVKQQIDPEHIYNLGILLIPLSVIGARIYYVIFNWSYYRLNPGEIIAVWHGGLAIHGGVITGLLVGYAYCRWQKLHFGLMCDLFAPSLILGQAIGRWGNFVNQEAYGRETDLPWAMYIDGAYRHPTFLYESLWNIGVFLFLLWQRKNNRSLKEGDLFLLYVIGYSVGRFFIEGLRTDSLLLGSLRMAQLVSLTGLAVAAVWFYWRHCKRSQA